jgi:aryl-alcohol dehydrogenase-like predicted oxidoreductase
MVMKHRRVGNLDVSVVGVGCNQFGPTVDQPRCQEIVCGALDLGINFFDTADEYGPEGVSEEHLGRALKGRRDEAVVATKFGHYMDGDPQRGGASARWIVRAVEDSLRRLGTDRIDLYQQHFPDAAVEPEETLGALDQLVRSGKILHAGVCNLDADAIELRGALARSNGFEGPVSAQNRYNLLRQETGDEIVPVLEANHMVLLPFFPLASGMLTGKYLPGQPLPPESRFARHLPPEQARHIVERDAPAVARLSGWARARDRSVAELAMVWLASQPIVASVIAGVTTLEQLKANARTAEWVLAPEEIDQVGALARGGA